VLVKVKEANGLKRVKREAVDRLREGKKWGNGLARSEKEALN
jgi:hypothetical protein